MKLIVGLGNPGTRYASNRHNIGFMCLSYFAKKHGIKLERGQSRARIGKGKIDGIDVLLARPQTYMNSSGESAGPLARFYKIDLPDLIVICDDLDLPLGKIRLRQGGSAGGHKGIKSIIDHVGSGDFVRLKIGIGRPVIFNEVSPEAKEALVVQYVLNDFTAAERSVIEETIPRAGDALLRIITEGLAPAMNEFNQGKPNGQ